MNSGLISMVALLRAAGWGTGSITTEGGCPPRGLLVRFSTPWRTFVPGLPRAGWALFLRRDVGLVHGMTSMVHGHPAFKGWVASNVGAHKGVV
jgi:hypothetical protein